MSGSAEEAIEDFDNVSSPKDIADFPYEMELAVGAPSRMAAGVALNAPLVVTFDASRLRGGRDAKQTEEPELSGIFAFLSLMSEDRREHIAPPDDQLLRGKKTDSVHLQELENDDTLAYAAFPNVAITKTGRYCFMISVIDINR